MSGCLGIFFSEKRHFGNRGRRSETFVEWNATSSVFESDICFWDFFSVEISVKGILIIQLRRIVSFLVYFRLDRLFGNVVLSSMLKRNFGREEH